MKKIIFFSCLIPILFFSCKKYEEQTISSNVAPPDETISNVVIENYINKVYISVLGRKASATEYNNGLNTLKQNNLSEANRQQFLDVVFSSPDYNKNLYERAKIDLLNNLDTTDIDLYIFIFTTALADSANIASWSLIQSEMDKLLMMQTISVDLETGVIGEIGLFKRCCYNFFYDQINMGSLNFVVSVFQHFLDRYPTDNEIAQGILMVDGSSGSLFLQTGLSKSDFLNIFFSSDDYYEGQVRQYYRRFIFREPNSVEMGDATQLYKTTGNYKQMQKNILASDEYIGL